MANPPRDTERLQIRLERRISEPLRVEADRRKMANVQALITKLLEDFVDNGNASGATVTPSAAPEIDLRSMLIESHKANAESNRTIAEMSRTIAALMDERKNAFAEPAGVVVNTSSTAAPEGGGRNRVVAEMKKLKPQERERLIADIRESGEALLR